MNLAKPLHWNKVGVTDFIGENLNHAKDALEKARHFTATDRRKLIGILNRLASDADGERAAAGLLATNLIQTCGMNWTEVIVPPNRLEGWRSNLALCGRNASALTMWECTFIIGMARQKKATPKQTAMLSEIAQRLRDEGLS